MRGLVILVLIPLCTQVLCLGVGLWVFHKNSELENAEAVYGRLLANLAGTLETLDEAQRQAFSARLTGNERFSREYSDTAVLVRQGLRTCLGIGAELPDVGPLLRSLEAKVDVQLNLLSKNIQTWPEQQASSDGGMRAASREADTHSEVRSLFSEVIRTSAIHRDDIVNSHRLSVSVLVWVVLIGMVASSVITVFALIVIQRSISTRLRRTIDNIRRFRNGERILAAPDSSDELGEVESSLADMASRLRDAREFEQAVLSSIPAGVLVIDQDRNIRWASSRLCTDLQRDSSQLVGRSVTGLVDSTQLRELDSFWSELETHGHSSGFDTLLIGSGGQRLPFRLSGRRSAAGETYCVAINTLPEQQHARRIAHLATYPEQHSEPVVEITAGGQVTLVNALAQHRFPDIRTQGFAHPTLNGLETMLSALTTGRQQFVSREVTLDGYYYQQRIFYLAQSSVFRVFFYDITKLKQDAASLREAKEQAEQASKAKSDFLSRMSHELRTPLNSILGFGELLKMNPVVLGDAGSSKQLDRLLTSAVHLLNLVNDVLDLSLVETGQMSVRRESISVRWALVDAVAAVAPMASAKAIRIVGIDEGPDVFVVADRTRLRQIILNLLTNAIKYNKIGGTVSLSWKCRDSNVMISVGDQGPGIAPDQVTNLFKPFVRLTGSEHQEGTGVGLAIVRGLCELMGGSVDLRSYPGRGSVFTVALPQGSPCATVDQISADQVKAQVEAMRKSNVVILYIEDNLVNRELITEILKERPNTQTVSATRGDEGLRMAHEILPSLIILDIRLPDMDGYEVLRHLRADPRTRNIPVVALTAQATADDVRKGLAMGFSHYVTKPVRVTPFLELIESILCPGNKAQ